MAGHASHQAHLKTRLAWIAENGGDPWAGECLDRLVNTVEMRPVWAAIWSDGGPQLADAFLAECALWLAVWSISTKSPAKALKNRLQKIESDIDRLARALDVNASVLAFHGASLRLTDLFLRELPGKLPPKLSLKENVSDVLRALSAQLRTTHDIPLISAMANHLPRGAGGQTAPHIFLARGLTRFFVAHMDGTQPEFVARSVSALFDCDIESSGIGHMTRKIRTSANIKKTDFRPNEWRDSQMDHLDE